MRHPPVCTPCRRRRRGTGPDGWGGADRSEGRQLVVGGSEAKARAELSLRVGQGCDADPGADGGCWGGDSGEVEEKWRRSGGEVEDGHVSIKSEDF